MWGESPSGQTESPDVGSLCEERNHRRSSVVSSVAVGARVVQATPACDWLSTSSTRAGAREGDGWREEVQRWREGRLGAVAPNGLSWSAYLHAGTLRVSGGVLEHRIRFGVAGEAPKGGRRGEVRPWTVASRRRLRVALRRAKWQRHAAEWCVVTLTMPGNDVEACVDGEQVQRWRRAWMERWRRKFGLLAYAWKLEFQARGAPHFAVVLPLPSDSDQEPNDLRALRAWVGRSWYEVVGSGSAKHLRAGTHVARVHDLRALSSYIVGELVKGHRSKEYQHVVPAGYTNVGRWWGVSRNLCEPWSEFGQSERQANATRRILARMVRSPRYRGVVRRSMRKRVSSMTVFSREDALQLGWRIHGLRL